MAITGGVGGDDLHPELQGASQDAGILVGSVDHRHGHLATGMTKKRQASGGHATPELIVLRQGAIDVLAIGQELERPCPARETTLELGERVLAAGMNRNRRHELRVGGTDLEQVVVRHMEGPKGYLRAGVIVDFVLSEQQGLIHVGPADERTQSLDILFVEVPVGERKRHADRPPHDLAEPLQPEAFHPQPTAAAVEAVTNQMNVAIIAEGRHRGVTSEIGYTRPATPIPPRFPGSSRIAPLKALTAPIIPAACALPFPFGSSSRPAYLPPPRRTSTRKPPSPTRPG